MGAKNCNFSLANLSGRLFKKAKKGGFYKVNGANNKQVGSVGTVCCIAKKREPNFYYVFYTISRKDLTFH